MPVQVIKRYGKEEFIFGLHDVDAICVYARNWEYVYGEIRNIYDVDSCTNICAQAPPGDNLVSMEYDCDRDVCFW